MKKVLVALPGWGGFVLGRMFLKMNEWVPVYRLGLIHRSLVYVHNLYMLLYMSERRKHVIKEKLSYSRVYLRIFQE
jgi:hypothetical protein